MDFRGTAGAPDDYFQPPSPASWPQGWAREQPGDPALILYPAVFRPMAAGRDWFGIQHQIGGMACDQVRVQATLLRPRPEVLAGMIEIEEKGFDGGTGGFGPPSLSECAAYDASLKRLFGGMVGCERSHGFLAEGFYPLDPTQEALAALCGETLPEDLDALVDWGRIPSPGLFPIRLAGSSGRWRCAILGANSD